MEDNINLRWRKSSYSGSNGGQFTVGGLIN